MVVAQEDSSEKQRRLYFDNNLRSCLVELVAACMQHKPGSDPKDAALDRYAQSILDPFFSRLADICLQEQPDDLTGFMKTWVLKQTGPEPEDLRKFVVEWLEWRAASTKPKLQSAEELEAKHAALVDAPCSTGLGICTMQKLAEEPKSFTELGLPSNAADVEPLKLLQHRLDHKDETIQKLNQKLMEQQQHAEKLQQEHEALQELNIKMQSDHQSEMEKLREKAHAAMQKLRQKLIEQQQHAEKMQQEHEALQELNINMQSEMEKLQELNSKMLSEMHQLHEKHAVLQHALSNAQLPQRGRGSASFKDNQQSDSHGPQPPGRPITDCINLILQTLVNDPKLKVSSAGQAWAFFEPDQTNQVDRLCFQEKVDKLDILTRDEITHLLDFVDYHGSGAIDYDEWKAGLVVALAANEDLHALPTEEEFNAVMFRINAKLKAKGVTAKEAFLSCDFDNSKFLSYDEFKRGMLQLKLGLSQKEVSAIFFAIDADQGGTLDLEEFEDAIEEAGTGTNDLKAFAVPIFRQVGESFIEKYCMQQCQELAASPGSEMMSFDGFVQVIRFGHPDMTLSSIMRLWTIVDKCGQGGIGFANIPDLVANILAATSTMSTKSHVKGASFAAAGAAALLVANPSSKANLSNASNASRPAKKATSPLPPVAE